MTTTSTTGTISSAGVGSGLDVTTIVSKLMAIERQPVTLLQTQQATYTSQISAMGQIKSSIAALQTAAHAMATTSGLYSYKATLADTTIASATTSSTAVAGTYSLEVDRLATNHKLISAAGADASAGGTLNIQIGSTASGSFVGKSGTSSVAVTINAGASLTDVASAINSANAGVSASVINGTGGAQLVLTSNSSGEAGQIKITTAMSGFAFDPVNPTTTGNLTQKDAGLDAIVKIDGVTLANTSSNTVTNGITGVTLNLTKTNINTPTQLTISNDTSNLATKAAAFVSAYNATRALVKTLTQYDSTGTSTSGVLNGDGTVSSALNQLRNALSSVPSGVDSSYQHLFDMGINSQSDGTLSLNSTTLQTATTANFAAVATSLAAYGTAFDKLTTSMNSSDGLITSHTTGLTATSKRISDRITQMNTQLTMVEARYRAQYTNLDTLMANFQTTSTYLTQQLAALSKSS